MKSEITRRTLLAGLGAGAGLAVAGGLGVHPLRGEVERPPLTVAEFRAPTTRGAPLKRTFGLGWCLAPAARYAWLQRRPSALTPLLSLKQSPPLAVFCNSLTPPLHFGVIYRGHG